MARGTVTPEVSFRPNRWIRQGAKRVTSALDVMEERATPLGAAFLPSEAVRAGPQHRLPEDEVTLAYT